MKKKGNRSATVALQQSVTRLLDTGRNEEAWKKIRARLMLAPNDPWFLGQAGRYCRRHGRLDEAQRYYQRAVALQPRDAGLLNGLGLTCYDQGNFADAEKYYRAALSLIQGYTACHNNYGVLLHKADRHLEAIEQYQHVLAADPDYVEARYGLSSVLSHLQRLDEAQTHLRRILAQRPDHAAAEAALGMVLLQQGEFDEGWRRYRARYAQTNPYRFVTPPRINRPYWQGESLQGKCILVFPEQGFGDSIQFCRFATRLKAEKGAKAVYMICRRELYPLLRDLPHVDRVLIQHDHQPVPEFDCWSLMLDLPRHFLDSDQPFGPLPPYLQPDPQRLEKWRLQPDAAQPFTVGVVWKGSAGHNNDRHRSLPHLWALKPLWSVPGVRWISLQKGPGEEEAQRPDADQPIRALGHLLEDFADSAALVSQLDLVVTVDTSVAHLAGALAVPCWVMIPCISTDWRWLQGRDDSPWYPSLRLFHRAPGIGWDETVSRLQAALAARVTAQPTATP